MEEDGERKEMRRIICMKGGEQDQVLSRVKGVDSGQLTTQAQIAAAVLRGLFLHKNLPSLGVTLT